MTSAVAAVPGVVAGLVAEITSFTGMPLTLVVYVPPENAMV